MRGLSWDTRLVVCLLTLLLGLVLPEPVERLALWIDGKEIEQFVGVPMDIYVVKDGSVVSYLQDTYITSRLPILPQEVKAVEISWAGPDDLYTYKFSYLRSLDPSILYSPLLSIPQAGFVPKHREGFQMTIPCTGQVTAIASMYIVLQIYNSQGLAIPGSPLKVHLRKRCIAFQNKRICRHDCQNGGQCNKYGRCECKPGYLGDQCQLASCFPACLNNGSCVRPHECLCESGYEGKHCENAICNYECQHGGSCIAPEQCDCEQGYYGNYCQHKIGLCKNPCQNGGTCTESGFCACIKGYAGLYCQTPICKKPCGVHGSCVDVNTCGCEAGWRGRFCHKVKHDKKRKSRKRSHEGGDWDDDDYGESSTGEFNRQRRNLRRRRKRDRHERARHVP